MRIGLEPGGVPGTPSRSGVLVSLPFAVPVAVCRVSFGMEPGRVHGTPPFTFFSFRAVVLVSLLSDVTVALAVGSSGLLGQAVGMEPGGVHGICHSCRSFNLCHSRCL